MTFWTRVSTFALAAMLALAAGGCATVPAEAPNVQFRPVTDAAGPALDPALAGRILALDAERVSDADVREVLARGPTPRIVLLHGGVVGVQLLMASFGEFLVGMGYPEAAIRDPSDGAWSWSPYDSSVKQAGAIAWYYEQDGVRPMIVGHSQGGIQAVKILWALAGEFGPTIEVYDPKRQAFTGRTVIRDPLTGQERPALGVSVSYASVVGTGGWALAMPSAWVIASRVRDIPDTAEEFVGYRIELDLIAWDIPGLEGLKTFRAVNRAIVRNVTLPAVYSHVFVPDTAHLVSDPAMRDWINAYDASDSARSSPAPAGNSGNIYWAAEIWHDIKRHWVLEAQRAVLAGRARPAPASASSTR